MWITVDFLKIELDEEKQAVKNQINIMAKEENANLYYFNKGWICSEINQVHIITGIAAGKRLQDMMNMTQDFKLKMIKKWSKQIIS